MGSCKACVDKDAKYKEELILNNEMDKPEETKII